MLNFVMLIVAMLCGAMLIEVMLIVIMLIVIMLIVIMLSVAMVRCLCMHTKKWLKSKSILTSNEVFYLKISFHGRFAPAASQNATAKTHNNVMPVFSTVLLYS